MLLYFRWLQQPCQSSSTTLGSPPHCSACPWILPGVVALDSCTQSLFCYVHCLLCHHTIHFFMPLVEFCDINHLLSSGLLWCCSPPPRLLLPDCLSCLEIHHLGPSFWCTLNPLVSTWLGLEASLEFFPQPHGVVKAKHPVDLLSVCDALIHRLSCSYSNSMWP